MGILSLRMLIVEKGENIMIERLEALVEWGGTKKDIAFLVVSGLALILSLLQEQPAA